MTNKWRGVWHRRLHLNSGIFAYQKICLNAQFLRDEGKVGEGKIHFAQFHAADLRGVDIALNRELFNGHLFSQPDFPDFHAGP